MIPTDQDVHDPFVGAITSPVVALPEGDATPSGDEPKDTSHMRMGEKQFSMDAPYPGKEYRGSERIESKSKIPRDMGAISATQFAEQSKTPPSTKETGDNGQLAVPPPDDDTAAPDMVLAQAASLNPPEPSPAQPTSKLLASLGKQDKGVVTFDKLSVAAELAKHESVVQQSIDDAVPESIKAVDRSMGTGSYMRLGPMGSGYWGSRDDASYGLDYDYGFVGTKKITPPARTTNFLKVWHNGDTPEWVGAMPETQDTNATVYDVTKNRIYLPGAIVG